MFNLLVGLATNKIKIMSREDSIANLEVYLGKLRVKYCHEFLNFCNYAKKYFIIHRKHY